ncbi:hypothetical protein PA598K_05732 [Paenibacillus sp. 598K]|uniref:hypothetical protein n=1 Tax=Paenibacillus sp. 598K TaxID=1117987 RepID=UPI000FF96506|nr:hypothetical protein [Paenibacillus sp. 598K]GBF77197.1 hypothetical protein PA598K_05732 [Paenibacillus sp. 598K]
MLKRKFVIVLAAAVLSITVIIGLNSAIKEEDLQDHDGTKHLVIPVDVEDVVAAAPASIDNEQKAQNEQRNLNSFSEPELKEIQEKLRDKEHLGVTLTAIKVDANKVDIYISEENYKKNKNDILDDINPSAVHFIFGDFKVVDQAAYIPGEH